MCPLPLLYIHILISQNIINCKAAGALLPYLKFPLWEFWSSRFFIHYKNTSPSSCLAGQKHCRCCPFRKLEHSALKASSRKQSPASFPVFSHSSTRPSGSSGCGLQIFLSRTHGNWSFDKTFGLLFHRWNKDHQRGCSTNSHTHYLCNLLPRCSFCSMSTLTTYRKVFPCAVLSVCSRISTVGISSFWLLQVSCPEFT